MVLTGAEGRGAGDWQEAGEPGRPGGSLLGGLQRRAEVELGPVVGLREQAEALVWIHGGGVPDDAQHRNVGVAVAEGVAVGEIEPVLGGVLTDEARLLRAGDDGLQNLAGGKAVLDLETVTDG